MTLLQQAVQHHQAGDWQPAEILYRQVLQMQPQHSDALHLLGQVLAHFQKYEEAQTLIEQAIQVNSTTPDYYNSLGNVLGKQRLWQAAEKSFQQALTLDPQFAEAHYNFGNVLKDQGQLEQAEAHLQQAVTLRPEFAQAYYTLGRIFHQQSQFNKAMASYQRAIAIQPNFAEAHNNLGNTLKFLGSEEEAKECFQRALTINSSLIEALCNLSELCLRRRQFPEAVEYLQRALNVNSKYNIALYLLASVFEQQGKLHDAVACYQKLLEINPHDTVAHNNIGKVLWEENQFEQALNWYRQALAKNPKDIALRNNLGIILLTHGQISEAMACFQTILASDPNFAEAYAHLGAVASDMGQLEEAIAYYRRALTLKSNTIFQQSICLISNYSAVPDEETLFAEHQKVNEQHAIPLAKFIQPFLNACEPSRKLKIGYVSPDFRQHSVAYFMEPILAHHNRQQFEIYCYYSNTLFDDVTQRFQQYADQWNSCAKFSDLELVEQIRRDNIDILVDLAGHTANNQLAVFARRPAPVQVTYLGYPSTTGLFAMDYRLTDNYIDVPANETLSSEMPIKLPACFYCYQPHQNSPPVNELPALQTGYVTFGCLNSYSKVTPPLLELWAAILQALPHAKLLMQNISLADATARQSFETRLNSVGIATDRVIIKNFAPVPEYLKIYHQVDIALDTYPCNGGTTTCEALWMGIPVVTLVGKRHVSRLGLSILSTLGLTDLIATTPEEYVKICIQLANRLNYLQQLRHTMRQRMQASPLMDAPVFTRQLEEAYRQMWKNWCKISFCTPET